MSDRGLRHTARTVLARLGIHIGTTDTAAPAARPRAHGLETNTRLSSFVSWGRSRVAAIVDMVSNIIHSRGDEGGTANTSSGSNRDRHGRGRGRHNSRTAPPRTNRRTPAPATANTTATGDHGEDAPRCGRLVHLAFTVLLFLSAVALAFFLNYAFPDLGAPLYVLLPACLLVMSVILAAVHECLPLAGCVNRSSADAFVEQAGRVMGSAPQFFSFSRLFGFLGGGDGDDGGSG